MTESFHKSRRFKSFVNPRTMIFGICLLNVLAVLVVTLVRIRQLESVRQATGFSLTHAYPTAIMVAPLLLLGAAVGLLINRWWSVLLAMLMSIRVIYTLGYLPWTAVYFAQGIPMLSWQALEKLWGLFYEPQPQYLVAVALGVVVFAYAVLLSLRFVYFRSARPPQGG
jgi:hypothetical protein